MITPRHVVRVDFIAILIVTLMLASCNGKTRQDQLLRELNVENAEQFASLSPCRQIEVYTIVGSEFLDVDHMVALVPSWMDDVISKQPPEVIAGCIADEGQRLLSQWGDDPSQYKKESFKMHALIYKAIELHLLDYPEIKDLVHRAICETNLYEKGSLDIYFYNGPDSGLTNYPSVEEMEIEFCR